MKSYTLRPDPERPAADPAQRDRQLAPQDANRAEELLGGSTPSRPRPRARPRAPS